MAQFISKYRGLRVAGLAKFNNYAFYTNDEDLIAKLRNPALGYGSDYAEGPSVIPQAADTIISGTRTSQHSPIISPTTVTKAEAAADTQALKAAHRLGYLRGVIFGTSGKQKVGVSKQLLEEFRSLDDVYKDLTD